MHKNEDTAKYIDFVNKWYGWGSPIGLSLFFLIIAITFLVIILAFKLIYI